ncbi:diaminopimelate epimerase [Sandarakinorhabdus limnophila]|uniref:diaminopimelate epimerase n=1 Tax=Sandarakinorhabdus limnophila TaxID=210512 RepID=UPI0003B3A9C4|nr:diaminopimelate epimerase [Sandarakinorhabdus limnophila]
MTHFIKMHGLGNDFLVLDAREQPIVLSAAQVRALANRHTGIGFDQLILIEPSTTADLRLRFWNSDGGEVAACGNGSRAAATLLGGQHRIETAGGLLDSNAHAGGAEVDMGAPQWDWDAVPVAYPMDTANLPLAWDDLDHPAALSVGNPHVVFFVPDAAAVALEQIGPTVEHDPVFPERVNVGIAQVTARDHMILRVWERGAGATLACGTGAVAAVAAAQRRGLVDAQVRVSLPGGDLTVTRRDDGHLLLAGAAVIAYTGDVDLERFA